MKKNSILYTACLAMTAGLAACSTEEVVEEQQESSQITMTAEDFKVHGDSRVNIVITPERCAFTWAENDTVGIFPNEGAQVYFPMINGKDTKVASFTGGGWALKSSSVYSAYYPFIKSFEVQKESIPVSFGTLTQHGNGSSAHLGEQDYMAAQATTPDKGTVRFNFKHLVSLVELTLNLPNKGDLTSVILSTDQPVFTREGTIDITEAVPQIKSTSLSKSITLNVKGLTTTADKEEVKVYLMMAPVNLANQDIQVEIYNNGVSHKGTVKGMNFMAGEAYPLSVTMGEQKPIQNEYTVTEAGTLPQLIGEENKFKITELKVSGALNGTDIRFLREMAGRDVNGNLTKGILTNLDLYDANIVEGGDWYYYDKDNYTHNNYTQNDILGDYMFYQCGLIKIILPKAITSIGRDAFDGCRGLVDINVPNSVLSIGDGAFYDCIGITSIDIPESVLSIGNVAFSSSGIIIIDLPDGVKKIGAAIFGGCTSLQTVTIPSSVKSIRREAFIECSSLNNLTILKGVESIEDNAFENCNKLKNINVPSSVKILGYQSFLRCDGLTNVTLSEGIETIGSEAFSSCDGLTEITIPGSVSSIGDYVFSECYKLATIKIKARLTILENNIFGYSNVHYLTLPSTLKQIRANTLPTYDGLGTLEELYCFAVEPPVLYVNNEIPEDCKIYVPKGSVDKYKSAARWKDHAANILPMPEGVTE